MSDRAKPYMNPYLAGTLLGIVLFLAFFITGSGLGASGGLNRMLVYVQNLFVPEHIDQVPYLLKMAGGSTNPLNSWIVYLTAGTIIGGFISGLFGRDTTVQVAGTDPLDSLFQGSQGLDDRQRHEVADHAGDADGDEDQRGGGFLDGIDVL